MLAFDFCMTVTCNASTQLQCFVLTFRMATLQEKDVINAIKDVSNWRELGVQLGIKFSKLDEFDQYPVYERKLKVIEWWMDNDTTDCGWPKLIEALQCMGHTEIAQTIRNKYLKKETGSNGCELDDEVFNNTQLSEF